MPDTSAETSGVRSHVRKANKADKTPKPLTQSTPPKLDWSRPTAPAAIDFNDIYFSVDGGREETRAVFLEGCGLPGGWRGAACFTIGELGFGSGLNFLETWNLWEKDQASAALIPNPLSGPLSGTNTDAVTDAVTENTPHLHYISFEKFPFSADELARALALWPELKPYAARLIAQWPERVKGIHRLHFGRVTLTLIHDDILAGLYSLSASVNAWFLDGFNPAKNPEMWSQEVMHNIARLSAPDARLATFTVTGDVCRTLGEAGFTCEKKTGFARKRHRLEAQSTKKAVHPAAQSPSPKRGTSAPTIIGSGIGGASLARAFLRRGITPRIITQGNAFAASANPAALIKPRLDLQDRPESRFFLSSYLYALGAYADAEGIISRGVTHLPKSEREAVRFEKLVAQAPLPPEHLKWTGTALMMPSALTINPSAVIERWMDGANIETGSVDDLSDIDGPVFCAAGYGVKALIGQQARLRYSRGQISWAKNPHLLSMQSPLSYGGYVIPIGDDVLVGATHDRLTEQDPFTVRPEDDMRNFEQFESATGLKLQQVSQNNLHHDAARKSRASVRVTTASTLPRVIMPAQDRYILTGLGSRGFVFAPLLGEAIVSHYLAEPLPIENALWERFGGY